MDFVNTFCESCWLCEQRLIARKCLNTCTPLRQYAVSSTLVMMQEQAWMHASSSPFSPPCSRLILSSLNNTPLLPELT